MSVITIPPSSSGSGSGYPPGSPDVPPASPSSYNDEFTSFSGWTTLGTLDSGTPEVTTRPSHVYLKRTTASGDEVDGIYKAAPTVPFTVTCKLAEEIHITNASNLGAGLLLTEASPGKLFTAQLITNSGYGYWLDALTAQWTNRTSRSTTADHNVYYAIQLPFKYQRLVVTSTTAEYWPSADGFIWRQAASATAHGLTVANVGLAVTTVNGTALVDAMFDWIRFS